MKHSRTSFTNAQYAKIAVGTLLAAVMTTGLLSRVGAQAQVKQNAATPQTVLSVPERFAADLKTLAARMKITFVVEGQPIGTRSEAMPDALQAALAQEGAVTEETVKGLAEYYDYSAVRHGSVFVLTKLYTDPDDLPDVTLQECRLAVQSASRLLAPFKPNIPPLPPLPITNRDADPLSTLIVSRLTPQQFQTLSQDGLVVGALAAPQQDAVWQMALHIYIEGRINTIQGTADFLDALAGQDPLFHWQQVADVVPFGYDFHSPKINKMVFVTISHLHRVAVAPDGMMVTLSSYEIHNGVRVEVTDPTDPVVKKTVRASPAAPSLAITLAAAMTQLNGQSRPKAHCQVDAFLAAKRVMIVGTGEADAAKLMDALADVYGLRVRHTDAGDLILTRLRDASTLDIMGLGKALRGVTPAPLMRALHARLRTQHSPPLKPGETPPSLLLEGDYSEAASAMCLTAVRELRVLAEPKVRAAKEGRLPLSRLGEREQKLFAIRSVIYTLGEICSLAEQPAPPYISGFDHVLMTGGPYQN